MIRISIHLPTKHRVDLSLVKTRKNLDEKPLIPPLGKVLHARAGNKVSRFFRLIFENEKIKKVLGTNLALLVVASSLLPANSLDAFEPEENMVQPRTVLTTQKGVQYPLNNIKISQGYRFFHPGFDFDGTTGDFVYPIMAGKVESTDHSRFAYGNSVMVSHGNGVTSLYAHLSRIEVSKGQEVNKETKLGEVGATGRASGDHLHLEIRENGLAINPSLILPR